MRGEAGRQPLFPYPLFSLFFVLGRGFPIYKPSRREQFNFKPQYNQPQANPPPALAPERETFPPALSLPKQAALQMDARGSPLPIPSPLRSLSRRKGRRRAESRVVNGTRQDALISSSSAPPKSLSPCLGDLPLPKPSALACTAPQPAIVPQHGGLQPPQSLLSTDGAGGSPQTHTADCSHRGRTSSAPHLPLSPASRHGEGRLSPTHEASLSPTPCPPSPQPSTHYL